MTRTALTNVRVFDGRRLTERGTVVIDGDVIGTDPAGARIVDGDGAVLLPGLIDAHVHLTDRDVLGRFRDHGVVTALDMGFWDRERLATLRGVPGVTDIRSAGVPAIGPGGPHSRFVPVPEAIVLDVDQARRFVANRVADGSDYVKIVAEAPGEGGPEQPVLDALVDEAHRRGLLTVTHAASAGAVTMAVASGTDLITHVPLDRRIADPDVARLAADGRAAVPTLTMMEGLSALRGSYDAAAGSVAALHRAGVPILAGTDANATPGVPVHPEHGASLHNELELLVDAGLGPVDALRAATVLPARCFNLPDRGAVEPGLRADLVLIDGDPIADITSTRAVRAVWCGGVEHRLA